MFGQQLYNYNSNYRSTNLCSYDNNTLKEINDLNNSINGTDGNNDSSLIINSVFNHLNSANALCANENSKHLSGLNKTVPISSNYDLVYSQHYGNTTHQVVATANSYLNAATVAALAVKNTENTMLMHSSKKNVANNSNSPTSKINSVLSTSTTFNNIINEDQLSLTNSNSHSQHSLVSSLSPPTFNDSNCVSKSIDMKNGNSKPVKNTESWSNFNNFSKMIGNNWKNDIKGKFYISL